MTVEFGGDGDISATLEGGSFGGDSTGRDITAVLISRAADDASAAPNTAIPINSRITSSGVSTVRAFGESSQMAEQLQAALQNGATPGLLYGVAPEEIAVTAEQIPTGSGVTANAPVVPQKSDILVERIEDDGSGGTTRTEVDVNFVYETLPTAPTGETDTVNFNHVTGEFEAADSADYEISYDYLDYETAIDVAADQIKAGDAGAIFVDSISEGVGEKLQSKLEEIRPRYELAMGGIVAQPNATDSAGNPVIDVEDYTDSLDSDGLVAFPGGTITPKVDPATGQTYPLDATTPLRTLAGGLLGRMASNELTDTLYHDVIEGYDDYRLTQTFTDSEIGDQENPASGTLRGKQLAPVAALNSDGSGEIRIRDDLTTSTEDDWLRTHHRVQVADNVLLNFRKLAQRIEDDGEFQTNSVLQEIKQSGLEIFEDLGSDGVILSSSSQTGTDSTATAVSVTGDTPASLTGTAADPDSSSETNTDGQSEQYYAVEVTRTSVSAIEIQFAYIPTPVIKSIDLAGVIYDTIPANTSGTTNNETAA